VPIFFCGNNLRLREVAGSALQVYSLREYSQGKETGQAASLGSQNKQE
jgi:hypothetical protein